MIVLLLLSIFVVFLFHELYWKRRGYPPGPLPLPLLGNMLALNSPAPGYESFNKWTKQYGDIYTFWLGTTPYIMINTYEKMKETFIRNGDIYADKKPQEVDRKFRGGSYGLVESNGEMWREHRRFALSTLRDFGLGKGLMQEKILIEVHDIFDKFDKLEGKEIDMVNQMNHSVGNVINQITFGYRFDGDREEQFHFLKNTFDSTIEEFGEFQTALELFIPSLRYFLPGSKLSRLIATFKTTLDPFFNAQIKNHREEIDFSSTESSDYVEAYLKEQKKRESEGDFESFSNIQLTNSCLDMWAAGLSTTTTTISWGFAHLLHNPEVQEKLHKELDDVIGSDRVVTTSDKNDLPFMNAFINEAQRCTNLLPLNVFHMTTQDTEINGYPIKKGTGVIAQISTVMLDETLFPNPNTFNPDRFIENGKLKKIEEFTPFSVGKRQCLGEGLARMELFLFFSNVINRYKIRPSTEGLPSLDKSQNTRIQEKHFKCKLEKRFK